MSPKPFQSILNLVAVCHAKGVCHAVLCPGSRNAPLIAAFASHPGFKPHSCVDERSGAYVALGLAQQGGAPAVFVCTSGTAALNAGPAVAEAFYQQVPLVVLTADRPAEWIDQQDGQAVRQERLLDAHVKGSFSFPVGDNSPDTSWHAVRMISEALNLSMAQPQGPVHINVPLREPLYFPADIRPLSTARVKIIEPMIAPRSLSPKQLGVLLKELNDFSKIWILAGQGRYSAGLQKALAGLKQVLPAPVTGDITSNLSGCPGAFTVPDYAAALLGKEHAPDLLITFGRSVLSKQLKNFFRQNRPAAHWHIGEGAAPDTFQCLTRTVEISPKAFFQSLSALNGKKSALEQYGRRLRAAVLKEVARYRRKQTRTFSEFSAVDAMLKSLPAGSTLHLGNSLPVRLADHCAMPPESVEVFSNRGTSGIDGSLSTAVGHALADPGRLHVCLLGDLSFFYDSNGLWQKPMPANLRVMVLNNFGGGIFSLIKGTRNHPHLRPYITTPHQRTAEHVAKDFGLSYVKARSLKALGQALSVFFRPLPGLKVLEVQFKRMV